MLAVSSDTAEAAERVGEQEEIDQIKAPFGVAETIKLYEAAFPHYRAARQAPTSSVSPTTPEKVDVGPLYAETPGP